MPNNTIVPTLGNTESSYVISVQGIAQTPIQVPKEATKLFILDAMADFLTTATNELRQARANNRLALRHLR